jgi:membrane protein YdbS with pleckstrin-like domain
MLENLIEKVKQKSLTPYDMLFTMIASGLTILFSLIAWFDNIYNNYQHGEIIWFSSKLFIFVSIIVVGIYFIKKLFRELIWKFFVLKEINFE